MHNAARPSRIHTVKGIFPIILKNPPMIPSFWGPVAVVVFKFVGGEDIIKKMTTRNVFFNLFC
jgi:hypothetical protein